MAAIPSMLTFSFLFGMLCIVCNFGESVTDRFEHFESRLCRYKWYSLSIKMQIMYSIFVADTQQTVTLRSFGNIEVTRETLKKVNWTETEVVQF